MDPEFHQGQKILVELTTGEVFEGILVRRGKHEIVLDEVSEHPSQQKYDFEMKFNHSDVLTVRSFEQKPLSNDQLNGKECSLLKDAEHEHIKNLILNHVYLGCVDNQFFEMISYYRTCGTIAVLGILSEFGRSVKLNFLAIATRAHIYIFDTKLMDTKGFRLGLKDILESEVLLKIVHNSKMLADCLYHSHGVTLKNVFDTQVADLMITKEVTGALPENIKPISDCLNEYLSIPISIMKNSTVDIQKSSERPVSKSTKLKIATQVAYLLPLHIVLQRKMLNQYFKTVDCYIDVVKNATPTEAAFFCSSTLVPDPIKTMLSS